jgi:hypothetical protein
MIKNGKVVLRMTPDEAETLACALNRAVENPLSDRKEIKSWTAMALAIYQQADEARAQTRSQN